MEYPNPCSLDPKRLSAAQGPRSPAGPVVQGVGVEGFCELEKCREYEIVAPYMGASLIRNCTPLGPYSSAVVLGGWGCFL